MRGQFMSVRSVKVRLYQFTSG